MFLPGLFLYRTRGKPIPNFVFVRTVLYSLFLWAFATHPTWPVWIFVTMRLAHAMESWFVLSVPLLANAADSCRGDLKARTLRIGYIEVSYGVGAITGLGVASLLFAIKRPFAVFPVRLVCGAAIVPLSLLLMGRKAHQEGDDGSRGTTDNNNNGGGLSPMAAIRTSLKAREGHARYNNNFL